MAGSSIRSSFLNQASMEFTHLDEAGRARMVDVGDKPPTRREAVARGWIRMQAETLDRIRDRQVAKGDVLAVARVAGIMAAKTTGSLIPLCHLLLPVGVELELALNEGQGRVDIEARVATVGPTGAEMEALTAVSVAALTIYDMCKALDRGMVIGDVRLVEKSGGRSGHYRREGETAG